MENTEWLNLTCTKKKNIGFSLFLPQWSTGREIEEMLPAPTPFPSSFLPFPHFLCSCLCQSIMFFFLLCLQTGLQMSPTVVWSLCHAFVHKKQTGIEYALNIYSAQRIIPHDFGDLLTPKHLGQNFHLYSFQEKCKIFHPMRDFGMTLIHINISILA